MRILILLLMVGGFVGISSVTHAGPFFDAMKAYPVVACNTFSIAYANGLYLYAEGHESSSTVEPPQPALEDDEAKQLYLDMVDAGIQTAIEYGAPRDKYTEIAPIVYKEMEYACKAARGSLSVIRALPHLTPFVEGFIERLESNRQPEGRRI